MALASLERWPEAIERFRQALRVRPDLAEAHNNLGIALVRTNLLPGAIEQFERALQIRPGFRDAEANLQRARETIKQPTSRTP